MRLFHTFRPFLMFVDAGASGGNTEPLTDDQFLEQHGFPRNTKTDDMTDAQEAAYWRHTSKKFQAEAKAKDKELGKWQGLGEFDAVSSTISSAEEQRQRTLTDAQRAQEEAQRAADAARAAGAAEGRTKFVAAAVEGQLVALTRGVNEKPEDAAARVKAAMQFVDVNRFVNETGDLDATAIQTFSQSIGAAATTQIADPLAAILTRQQLPQQGASGSVQAAREAAYERRSKKQKN